MTFYTKNAGISKIEQVLVIKSIIFETAYECVLTHEVSSFLKNSNQF